MQGYYNSSGPRPKIAGQAYMCMFNSVVKTNDYTLGSKMPLNTARQSNDKRDSLYSTCACDYSGCSTEWYRHRVRRKSSTRLVESRSSNLQPTHVHSPHLHERYLHAHEQNHGYPKLLESSSPSPQLTRAKSRSLGHKSVAVRCQIISSGGNRLKHARKHNRRCLALEHSLYRSQFYT